MSRAEQIHTVMAEIGPALDLAAVHGHAADHLWSLTAQDGTIIFVELDAEDDRLWLSAEVGPLPRPEKRLRLYELLLRYNALWREIGGVRLALDSPDDAIVQAYDAPAADMSSERLCGLLRAFRSTLDGWRDIVARADVVVGLPPLPTAGMIRG